MTEKEAAQPNPEETWVAYVKRCWQAFCRTLRQEFIITVTPYFYAAGVTYDLCRHAYYSAAFIAGLLVFNAIIGARHREAVLELQWREMQGQAQMAAMNFLKDVIGDLMKRGIVPKGVEIMRSGKDMDS